MVNVVIRGEGVAASCCAYLLVQAGCRVNREHAHRARLPAVMLSDNALQLIRDVFGRSDLFRDAVRIRRRVVAWRPGAKNAGSGSFRGSCIGTIHARKPG